MKMTEFNGKTVLVTGASRGIGAATAVAMARAGCTRVLIHYASNEAGARATLEAVEAAGGAGEIVHGDLSTQEGIEAFLASLAPHAGEVDILINNAGSLVERARLTEFTPGLYERVMNLNVKSLWFISQQAAAGMVARKSGIIVNVASIAARNGGGPGATIYAAAKAAVSAMTKGMAKELAPFGVRVNAVSPGTVDNDFHAKFSTREVLDSVTNATPLGRLSTNDDVADVVVFLCSTAARNIIGQTIEVNGGAFMI
jgi:3-oxoacyl-[acyl-carrier protein] reductase